MLVLNFLNYKGFRTGMRFNFDLIDRAWYWLKIMHGSCSLHLLSSVKSLLQFILDCQNFLFWNIDTFNVRKLCFSKLSKCLWIQDKIAPLNKLKLENIDFYLSLTLVHAGEPIFLEGQQCHPRDISKNEIISNFNLKLNLHHYNEYYTCISFS